MPRTTPPAETDPTPVPTDPRFDPDRLIRGSTIAVVVLVAIGAGVVSYGHAYNLVQAHGESGAAAWVVPATVDGLIYMSGMVLLQAARYKIRAHWLAYVGLWVGIAATVAANAAYGWGHGPIGALVSAWPALALIVSYELLMKLIRTGPKKGGDRAVAHDSATRGQCWHPVAENAEEAALIKLAHYQECLGEPVTRTHISTAFKVDRKKLGKLVDGRAKPAESGREDEPDRDTVALNGAFPLSEGA